MEALAVKQFFNCLSDALSIEHPGVFFFSDKQLEMLLEIVPEPAISTQMHDIPYLVYRLKQNVLGIPDPVDGKITREPENLIPFACELLAMRWDVIKDTLEDYTRCTVEKNQLSLAFVKQLANFSLKLSDYDPQLKLSIQRWMKVFLTEGKKTEFNIYALLIPTLTQKFDPISKDIISNSQLHRLILSDDGMSLFSLKNSQDSFDRGEGFFNLDVFPSRLFTPSEKERIRQKPLVLRPAAMVRTDFIVTKSHPAPRVNSITENVIQNMLARAVAVETDPALNFAAFKQKYTIENRSLSQQDIDCLIDIHIAKFRDDERIRCRFQKPACTDVGDEDRRLELEIERKRAIFRACLDTSGKAQSDNTLSFLALKARQDAIATITAEMLVYCHVLKQEQPDEHMRLMNQVLDDGRTQPKTFSYVLKYIPSAIDCSSVALLTNLTRIFKPKQQDTLPMTDSKGLAKSTAIPISGGAGLFSFFYSSSTEPQPKQREDPISVANKMAYSPERGNGFL